jgi:uncharacterized membrane protein YccC
VVLATLSVLRTNALGTGIGAFEAVAGSAVGFVVGSLIMIGVGDGPAVLWVALPIVVFVAVYAPRQISFLAGQAAFTVLVVVLFNVVQPSGWRVGLVRFEDVAIGCGVSIAVGILFWPRGAAAALGRALSDAFDAGSRFLEDVFTNIAITGNAGDITGSAAAATQAHLRLDDAARQFIAERGSKPISLDELRHLLMGATGLRLASLSLVSFAPLDLTTDGPPGPELRRAAQSVVEVCDAAQQWFAEVGQDLVRGASELPPLVEDLDRIRPWLQAAAAEAARSHAHQHIREVVRLVWATRVLATLQMLAAELGPGATRLAQAAGRHPGRLRRLTYRVR